MHLYLSKRENATYGDYAGFVVRAKSPKAARELILKEIGCWHGREFWEIDPITRIASNVKGKEEILLDSYIGD